MYAHTHLLFWPPVAAAPPFTQSNPITRQPFKGQSILPGFALTREQALFLPSKHIPPPSPRAVGKEESCAGIGNRLTIIF